MASDVKPPRWRSGKSDAVRSETPGESLGRLKEKFGSDPELFTLVNRLQRYCHDEVEDHYEEIEANLRASYVQELDLLWPSCGYNAVACGGQFDVLAMLEQRRSLKVGHIMGASGGARSAFLAVAESKLSSQTLLVHYMMYALWCKEQDSPTVEQMVRTAPIWEEVYKTLLEDKRVFDRVRSRTWVAVWAGVKTKATHVLHNFKTKEQCAQAFRATGEASVGDAKAGIHIDEVSNMLGRCSDGGAVTWFPKRGAHLLYYNAFFGQEPTSSGYIMDCTIQSIEFLYKQGVDDTIRLLRSKSFEVPPDSHGNGGACIVFPRQISSTNDEEPNWAICRHDFAKVADKYPQATKDAAFWDASAGAAIVRHKEFEVVTMARRRRKPPGNTGRSAGLFPRAFELAREETVGDVSARGPVPTSSRSFIESYQELLQRLILEVHSERQHLVEELRAYAHQQLTSHSDAIKANLAQWKLTGRSVDILWPGTGCNSVSCGGGFEVLAALEREGQLSIGHIMGASGGATSALLALADPDRSSRTLLQCYLIYSRWKEHTWDMEIRRLTPLWQTMYEAALNALDEEGFKSVQDCLWVSVWAGVQYSTTVLHKFKDRQQCAQAVQASGEMTMSLLAGHSIPGVRQELGRCSDGGSVTYFPGHNSPLLYHNTWYGMERNRMAGYAVECTQQSIGLLFRKGVDDMIELLSSEGLAVSPDEYGNGGLRMVLPTPRAAFLRGEDASAGMCAVYEAGFEPVVEEYSWPAVSLTAQFWDLSGERPRRIPRPTAGPHQQSLRLKGQRRPPSGTTCCSAGLPLFGGRGGRG